MTWSHPLVVAALAAALAAALLGRAVGIAHRATTRRVPHHRSNGVHRPTTAIIAGRVRPTWNMHVRHRRTAPGADVVAAWCDELSRRLRSGATLREALIRSSSTTPVLDPSLEEVIDRLRLRLERGTPVEEALADAAVTASRRRTIPVRRGDDAAAGHLALATSVIGASSSLGGANAQALDRAAAALRLRAADRQERAAHSAQARMSAHVLTLVPLGFLALMVTIDPGVRAAIASPTGAAIVAIGLLLNGIGWLWMRRVIGGAP